MVSLDQNELTYFGLKMPYGFTDLGQHGINQWLGGKLEPDNVKPLPGTMLT